MTEPDPEPTPPLPPKKHHRRWKRILRFVTLLVLALLGAGFAVSFFGTQTYHWRAFDIQVRMYPSLKGSTQFRFIPVGEVHAATHKMPVALQISLMNIDFDGARRLIAKPPPPQALELEFKRIGHQDLNAFAAHQILVGALGGLMSPLILRPRRLRLWLLATGLGAGFVAMIIFLMVRGFEPAAFETPTYTGALQQAEWVITLVKDGFNKVESLSVKLRNVATNLSRLYERINAVPANVSEENTITILHISDIHNNPGAVAFVHRLVLGMRADMVIDTGDLTDFGLPLEAEITKSLAEIKVPYLFVAGNHDSPAIVKAVRANRNAIILEGKPVQIEGLSIIGSPDPSSVRAGQVDTSPEALRAAGDRLAADYLAAQPPPDIVCVHDPLQAAPLIGKARLILCGHEHRSYVDTTNGTTICNAGTTGAAGARYFDKPNGVPMSAAVLSFARLPTPHLLFIDRIVLDGSLGEYSISRKSFGNNSPHAAP